jgi:transcriptional regulator with XRE-family HTH domain
MRFYAYRQEEVKTFARRRQLSETVASACRMVHSPYPNMDAATDLTTIEKAVSELGGRVAQARAERGWSLQQLADRAGVSAAAIHKVEKNGMTPTIATLMKIAAALGKSVSHFIEDTEPLRPVTHIRAGERARLYTSKQGLVLQNISGRYGPFFVAGAEAFVEPGADSGPEPMVHPGEELVLLLEGQMRFVVGNHPYDLEEGDSLHFRTTLAHSWSNPSDAPARAVWLAIRSS